MNKFFSGILCVLSFMSIVSGIGQPYPCNYDIISAIFLIGSIIMAKE